MYICIERGLFQKKDFPLACQIGQSPPHVRLGGGLPVSDAERSIFWLVRSSWAVFSNKMSVHHRGLDDYQHFLDSLNGLV